jgi:hypothetical protein
MSRVHVENLVDLSPFITELDPFFGAFPVFSEWYGYNQVAFGWAPDKKDIPALFYGVMNTKGHWYIICVVFFDTLGLDLFVVGYTKGNSDFWTNWVNRASLDYTDYSGEEVFLPWVM